MIFGTIYYGTGAEYDEASLQAYPPGSVIYTPAGVPHFMWAPIGSVLSQETGLGPTGLLEARDWRVDSSFTSATFGDIAWQASEIEGTRSALMVGDPAAERLYALFGSMAEGAAFPVHAHPDARLTTVISGTMYFGVGADFDRDTMRVLPPGSLVFTPAGVPHYMLTPDGAMLSQEAGFGPTGLLEPDEWLILEGDA